MTRPDPERLLRRPAGAPPLVIAHRGGALEAPENTLPALRRALRLGADGLEIDVRLTRDEAVVVVHDQDIVVRPRGRKRRAVGDLTLAELRAHDAGAEFHGRPTRIRIPTLAEALGVPDRPALVMVEVKRRYREVTLARLAAEVLDRSRTRAAVVWGSFSEGIVRALHEADPSVPLVAIVDSARKFESFRGLPIRIFAIAERLVTPALVARIRRRGACLWVFTVKSLRTAGRLQRLGADGLITDIPGRILETRRFRRGAPPGRD